MLLCPDAEPHYEQKLHMQAENSPTCCPMAKAHVTLQCTAVKPHTLSISSIIENTKSLPRVSTLLVEPYFSMQGFTLFLRLQVAHADAAWRISLCEQYFVIWEKLRQPGLTPEQEGSLRARLEMKAKETQSRSATVVSAYVGAFIQSFIHPILRSIINSFDNTFIHACIPSLSASFTHSFSHSFIRSLVCLFFRSFIHSFVRTCLPA